MPERRHTCSNRLRSILSIKVSAWIENSSSTEARKELSISVDTKNTASAGIIPNRNSAAISLLRIESKAFYFRYLLGDGRTLGVDNARQRLSAVNDERAFFAS